jgi:hypothetical protein
VLLNSSRPRWKLGKLESFGKSPMVRIFGGNDAFPVILWIIFGFRLMRQARLYGDNFGDQMKNYNRGRGTGIKLNLEKMARFDGLLFEIFTLIVTLLRCKSWSQGVVLKDLIRRQTES